MKLCICRKNYSKINSTVKYLKLLIEISVLFDFNAEVDESTESVRYMEYGLDAQKTEKI